MGNDTDSDLARLIADSRATVEASRRHLAQIKRDLKNAENANDTMRREMAAWIRSARK